jgi:ER degradation enhancer, mannosidase alpha-like 3
MPNRQARNYMDALLAFWPGLQVLKGDLKSAIKMHEALHQIVKKHDFLPEAVLFDHSVHWPSHPLRPEFLESTYYLYRATKDDYYLRIAEKMINQLENYSRTRCGYAAIADVKTKQHEDRMDSFVFAETFKYLYLLFEEDDTLLFDIDEFIFTTEAHLVPLNMQYYAVEPSKSSNDKSNESQKDDDNNNNNYNGNYLLHEPWKGKSCPSLSFLFGTTPSSSSSSRSSLNISLEAGKLRELISNQPITSSSSCQRRQNDDDDRGMGSINYSTSSFKSQVNLLNKARPLPLRANEFVAGRKEHMDILKRMGINLNVMPDGRVQLMHKNSDAESPEEAEMGILFMTEMLELSKQKNFQLKTNLEDYRPASLTLVSPPFDAHKQYLGGPAQFGYDLRHNAGLYGRLTLAEPIEACTPLHVSAGSHESPPSLFGKFVVAKRGGCMFVEKARLVERAGAAGLIIVDNSDETTHTNSALFSMSGDGVNDVSIPSMFLFGKEGNRLIVECV